MQTANFPMGTQQMMTVGAMPAIPGRMIPGYVNINLNMNMNGMTEQIAKQLAKGKVAVSKRVTSSLEKKVVRDSFDDDKKKRNQRVIAKSPLRETVEKKQRETEPKKASPKVKQMPLTQAALQEMNRIYFLQKMNRVREWVNQDQTDCLYPVFQF